MITVRAPERQPNRKHLVRMRSATSALVAVVLSSTIFLVFPATASSLKITGTSCKKLGLKTTTQNKNYQCVKKGKKLVWGLRTPVIHTQPTVSVTPTPKPTLSLPPSPSPEAAPFALPDPNTLTIPEAASKYMAVNTIFVGGSLACSVSLIRNDLGESIGIVTAQHCNLTDYQNKRHLGSDGKYYVIAENHVTANTGDVQDQLTSVGVVDKFYLPAAKSTALDLALGAFGGHSLQEVRTAYDKNRLTYAEIYALKPGDTIYLSGWPIDQFNNPGLLKRQQFVLIEVGIEDRLKSGYIADTSMVDAAVLENNGGSVCSYGTSGGQGFVMVDGKPKSIGVLRTFADFTGNNYSTQNAKVDPRGFQQKFNVTRLSKYSALCSFAYETPTLENGGVEVNVVTSTDQIPGYKP
jgi:hypothetical protein